MIGDMIAKARKAKGMTKTELARMTDINIGHLTHIEKGERNPSHKALKNICKALDIPYQQLMYTYDKNINEEQESYNVVKHISYDKILAVDNINSFIDYPANMPSAALAIKVPDDAISKHFPKDSYVFIEFNSPLNTKDYGLFSYNGQILMRKFYDRNGKIILKSDTPEYKDISINNNDTLYIIGKILMQPKSKNIV